MQHQLAPALDVPAATTVPPAPVAAGLDLSTKPDLVALAMLARGDRDQVVMLRRGQLADLMAYQGAPMDVPVTTRPVHPPLWISPCGRGALW